jgi:hypothetical protein
VYLWVSSRRDVAEATTVAWASSGRDAAGGMTVAWVSWGRDVTEAKTADWGKSVASLLTVTTLAMVDGTAVDHAEG